MSDFYTGKEPGQNNQQANPQQHPDGKNQASGPSNEYYYHKSEIDGTTNATTHTDQYQAYQPGSAGAQNNASYGGNDRYRWHYETYEKAAKKNGRKNGRTGKPNKGVKVFAIVLCAIFGIGVISLASVGAYSLLAGKAPQQNASQPADNHGADDLFGPSDSSSTSSNIRGGEGLSATEIYQKVRPSVVAVVQLSSQGTGTGSGIIMSEDGYIITNNHVVEGAQKLTVILSDETEYDATLIGTDEKTDLALIKIEATGLSAAEFGDSDALTIGDQVVAIGNPYGLEFAGSMTGGYISNINKNVQMGESRIVDLLQTDASINPGNSGGPLVNANGQVIGVVSSKLAVSMSASGVDVPEGIGFAIPVNTAKTIISDLKENGYVTGRPKLGVEGGTLNQLASYFYNIPENVQGVYVVSVDPDSDAAKKGVQAGDVITGANGEKITTMEELNAQKEKLSAGDTISLDIYRGGQTIQVDVVLMEDVPDTADNG